MLQRVAHAGLGRQMDDDLRLFFLDHTPDGRHIADIDDMGSEAVRRAEQGVPLLFQAHVIIGHHGIHPGDPMPVLQQAAAEMEADEPGAAGDKDLHRRFNPNFVEITEMLGERWRPRLDGSDRPMLRQALTIFASLIPLRSQTLRVSMISGRLATRLS